MEETLARGGEEEEERKGEPYMRATERREPHKRVATLPPLTIR